VFQHIKANDTIDPSLRLVAHNRNSNRTPQSKLLPSESVLTVEELEAQQLDRKVALDEAAVPKPQQQKRGMTVEELEAGVASVGLEQEQDRGYEYGHESGTLMTEAGVAVPTVKLRQWREALSIAEVTDSSLCYLHLYGTSTQSFIYIADRNFSVTLAATRTCSLSTIYLHPQSPRPQIWSVPCSLSSSISPFSTPPLHGL
jgi:hypothetical protein